MSSFGGMFSVYGLVIASMLVVAHWRGWSLDSANEVKDVPKSIRDNPGAYRQHYSTRSWSWGGFSGGGSGGGGGRYTGGK